MMANNTRAGSRADGRRERSPWLMLMAPAAGTFMMLLDTTVVNVAQQRIREGLGAGLTEIQWAIDAYLLGLTVFLLAAGRLGDLFGRRRVFVAGVGLFTIASALCGGAEAIGEASGLSGAAALIGARALQGVGAAAVLSQSMALVGVTFPPARRGAAFGVVSSVSALAAVIGPAGGGLLATHVGWEWVFLINLPIGLGVIVAARRLLPETRDPGAERRLDLGGMLLSGAGLLAIVVAAIEAARLGWGDPRIVGALGAGVALLGLFVWWERRAPSPMLRLELFRLRSFRAGNLTMAAFNVGFHGTTLPLAVYLQGSLGYSPAKAGVVWIPSALLMAAVAPIGGRLGDRVGSRGLLAAGFGGTALVYLFLGTRIAAGVSFPLLLGMMAVVGAAVGLTLSRLNAAPLRGVPAAMMGSASGVVNTTRTATMTVGVAVMASLLQRLAAHGARQELSGSALDSSLRARVAEAVAEGRFRDLGELGGAAERAELARLSPALHDAFATAMQATLAAAASVLLAGAGAALLLRGARAAAPAPAEARPERALAAD